MPEPKPSMNARRSMSALRGIWSYMAGYRRLLAVVVGLVVLSSALSLLGPYLIGYAIDHELAGGDRSGLVRMVILLAVVYALGSVSAIAQNTLMIGIAQKTVASIRGALFRRLLELPIAFFARRQQGDILSRLTNDIDSISQTLNTSIIQLSSSLLTFAGMLGLMVWLSPVLTLLTLIIVPLVYVGMRWITARTGRLFKEQQARVGELNGFMAETLSGQRIITVYSREQQAIEQFRERNEQYKQSAYWAQTYSGFISKFMIVLNNLSFAIIAAAGGLLALHGQVTIGVIVTFTEYARQFARPLNDLAIQFNTVLSAVAGAERVFETIAEEAETDGRDARGVPSMRGEIRFSRVSFSYSGEGSPVLADIDFRIAEGETVALVGQTGAGKSTIVQLLCRFYDADEGAILIDGQDIRSLRRNELRRQLGFVLQEAFLFEGTIRDNIRYGSPDASDEEVERAAAMANAHGFIAKLPDGYDTQVSYDRTRISEGQKQLIAIARVMLLNPAILILDEATSSVDTVTEIHIQDALSKLMRGRTSIVIAHRLNTIRQADQIIVLHQGRIAEKGPHAALLGKRGYYYDLHHAKQPG
ncbi:ABC transporter ATP-binding protein [Paenibacillus xanthanilyticus]|uniref:ABC transporter ATP-binding protein n=1 Tax=Paenibacillus xanthanilyticus TaxID=1783531 RepID=A0ABV8KDZ9_9BACL